MCIEIVTSNIYAWASGTHIEDLNVKRLSTFLAECRPVYFVVSYRTTSGGYKRVLPADPACFRHRCNNITVHGLVFLQVFSQPFLFFSLYVCVKHIKSYLEVRSLVIHKRFWTTKELTIVKKQIVCVVQYFDFCFSKN